MRSGSVIDLLALASDMVESLDPLEGIPEVEADAMVWALVAIDSPETTALLSLMADLDPESETGGEIREALRRRNHRMPPWVTGFTPIEIVDAALMTEDVFRDGEDIVVGFRTAAGEELILIVLVDHNLGSLIKDAFLVPGPLADTLPRLRERAAEADPDLVWSHLALADARARLESAVEVATLVDDLWATDGWPGLRPLVALVIRHLPEGGQVHAWEEIEPEEIEAIVAEFMASAHAAGLDEEHQALVRALVRYGAGSNPAGPLGWGPVQIEIFLAEYVPDMLLVPDALVEDLPEVLKRFVRFAHTERAIRPENTDETIAHIDRITPVYREALRLRALDTVHIAELRVMNATTLTETARAIVAVMVGDDAVETLDGAPLPDEPFDWEGIPEEARERVQEILDLCDRGCDALFDVEHRTAVRRLLARVARGDSTPLMRGHANTAAGALCWIVARANHSVGRRTAVRTKDLAGWFVGEKWSPLDRSLRLLMAAGIDVPRFDTWDAVGTPDLLIGAVRQEMLDLMSEEPSPI